MSVLGTVHTVFAVVAIVFGGAVVFLPKGTRWHRTLGHLYATAMLGLIVTAFFIYDLFGFFGPFHFAALVSLFTLAGGLWHVLFRRPKRRWIEYHAIWMSWSYIGLMAAFGAETLTRVVIPTLAPLVPRSTLMIAFWSAVVIGGGAMTWVGAMIKRRWLPRALARLPYAMRAERDSLADRRPQMGDWRMEIGD